MGQLEKVKEAVEAFPEYLEPNSKGQSLLHRAIRGQATRVVDYLLERGADIHWGDALGNTALHVSAAVGREDLVAGFLGMGARAGAPPPTLPVDTEIRDSPSF